VQQGYPGTEVERATAAIREIDAILHKGCMNSKSLVYQEITLDRAGAYLERARAKQSDGGRRDSTVDALNDANTAVAIVEDFTRKNPKESSYAWYWIAMTLQRAGRPWMALKFISTLDSNCCKIDQIKEFQGELLFELGMYDAASKAYSEWMSRASDYCGHALSLSHANTLRSRGFSIPNVDVGSEDNCIVLSGWVPYFRFSRKTQ
jgi:tetratricopeptide (TPR) repeat protein